MPHKKSERERRCRSRCKSRPRCGSTPSGKNAGRGGRRHRGKAVLDDLAGKYPGMQAAHLRRRRCGRFVNFYLNNEDIRYLDNLATPVKDGDELGIIPAVAGG